jgi:hypothetical protein
MSLYVTNESGDIYVTTPPSGGIAVSIYQTSPASVFTSSEMSLNIDEAKELAAILTREIANVEARMGV